MPHPRPDELPCVFGQYRLESLLGEGGMGCVFVGVKLAAEQRGVTMRRAVKVPHDFLLRRDRSFADSFFREARAAEAVQHDNVVRIHDVDVVDGVPFIAMDLLQGGPLDEVLAANVLAPAHLVEVGLGMAEGLEAIHEAHLVHRDIKPGNVFLTRQGGVKLLDLGIARLVSGGTRHTRTGTAKGTPGYMAPEQLAASEIDGRVDLFALGAVLSEAVLGEPVFSAPSLETLIVQMLRSDEIVRDTDVEGRVEARVPGLGAVVAGLLRQNPDARTASAKQVVRQLREVRRKLPPELVPEEGLRERVRAWVGDRGVTGGASDPGASDPGAPDPGAGSGPDETFELPEAAPGGTRVLDGGGRSDPPVRAEPALDKTRPLPVPEAPPAPRKRSGGGAWLVAGIGGCLALALVGGGGLVVASLVAAGTATDTGTVVLGDLPTPEVVAAIEAVDDGPLDAVVFRTSTGAAEGDTAPTPVPRGAFRSPGDGLLLFDIEPGEGPALESGDQAVIRYTGWLRDDRTQFDSTSAERPTFAFNHDTGSMIPGFDRGLEGMRAGGVRQIVIPAALAYGSEGRPPRVPPDADLVFEVELLSARGDRPQSAPTLTGAPVVSDAGAEVFELRAGSGAAASNFSVMQVEITVWNGIDLEVFSTYDQASPRRMTPAIGVAGAGGDAATRVLAAALRGARPGSSRVMKLSLDQARALNGLADKPFAVIGGHTVQIDVMSVKSFKIGGSLSQFASAATRPQETRFTVPPGGTLSCGGAEIGRTLADGSASAVITRQLDVPLAGLPCDYTRDTQTCRGHVFQGKSQCRCDGAELRCSTLIESLKLSP